MENLKLYRRRYIPNELIFLKDDIIIEEKEDYITTFWNTLKPRKDFSYGFSQYFLEDGIKVSKFYDKDGKFIYYYCDIVEVQLNEVENQIIFNDLLIDVKVFPSGMVKVLDVGEVSEALDKNLITIEQVKKCMNSLDYLLNLVYHKNFGQKLEKFNSTVENFINSEEGFYAGVRKKDS